MLDTRREFCKLVGGGLLMACRDSRRLVPAGQAPQASPAASDGLPDKDLADKWVSSWMNRPTRGPAGPLILSRFADPMYFLRQPIGWRPNPDQQGYERVTVPVGFVTDLASIPRIFWIALRPDGDYVYSAIVHDYLYWMQTCSRATADTIFRFSMQDFGVNAATIKIIYEMVRKFGGGSWDANQTLKKAGERRTLKRFPDDPRVKWTDWKKDASVFLI